MTDQPLGPRALRVYETLRERIARDEWPPGTRIPSGPTLAAALGVAPMTLRQAISQLATEGRLRSEHGRGTFVCEPVLRSVLVVDDEAVVRAVLHAHLRSSGYRILEASGPAEALAHLEADHSIALVLSDLAMPTTGVGVEFIRAVRRRWPDIPVGAVTAYPDDLADLHGTPECPVLVIAKPFYRTQIEEALRLAIRTPATATPGESTVAAPAGGPNAPVLVADDDADIRVLLRSIIVDLGFEVDEAVSGGQALQALRRRHFGHVFLDVRMAGGGPHLGAAIAEAHPHTTVVVSTAYPEDLFPLTGAITLLPKPFDEAAVRASLELRREPVHGR